MGKLRGIRRNLAMRIPAADQFSELIACHVPATIHVPCKSAEMTPIPPNNTNFS
jgi:hypothetical protein